MMVTNPLAVGIGLRYTRARRRNHFISFITIVSVAGITLGVAALIIVLSVMNGFQTEVRSRMLSMTAHASVLANGGLSDWQAVAQTTGGDAAVAGSAPFVNGQAMFSANGVVQGALLRGILPGVEPQVSEVGSKMTAGSLDKLDAGKYQIILGSELALMLGLTVGDKVTVVVPQARITPAGIAPRMRRFTVAGLFEVGMAQYDRSLALIHLRDAQALLRSGDKVSGLRLKLADPLLAPEISARVQTLLPGHYYLTDWTQEHANYFRAVEIEKRMMRLVLSLIVLVAVFNIVSALVMVVTDKESDIAVLRTMGLSPRNVMGVFITQGLVIGVLGCLLGVVIGVLVALNLEAVVATVESWFGAKLLPSNVYYISDLPSDLHWQDVWTIGLLSVALTLLATLYPASRAARVEPAESLRYE